VTNTSPDGCHVPTFVGPGGRTSVGGMDSGDDPTAAPTEPASSWPPNPWPCTTRRRCRRRDTALRGDGRATHGVLDLDAIERELAGVEHALRRLDDGTYWTDEVTGRPDPRRGPRSRSARRARGHREADAGRRRSRGRSRRWPPEAAAAAAATDGACAPPQGISPITTLAAQPLGARVWKLSARNSTRFAVSRVRGIGSPAERRAQLDEQFAIRTAEDVAKELGEMKGVLMKAGQLVSFIFEALPDDAQAALATLQADAAPMAPTLAAAVVTERAREPARACLPRLVRPAGGRRLDRPGPPCRHPRRCATWRSRCSTRACTRRSRSDLDAAEAMYAMFSAMMLKGLDAKGLVDELRDRMREELDYRLEARNVAEFSTHFAGHPGCGCPRLVPEFCTEQLLTTEWVEGMTFDQFRTTASHDTKQRAAEVVWRFAQHAITRHGAFNGDPHPGNYKFHHDGSVTFLDYGLVKRWSPGEWESLTPTLQALIVERDPEHLVDAMSAAGFLRAGHGLPRSSCSTT
jgi:hypothetical protein